MPFPKLRLKKKQQYNVASKAMYVITVELLDNNQLECTLTAESTGRDCMDNVCRRVNLQQPDLFGLKFYSRRPYPKYRWVDLDRPLKKQLDKYAQQPTGPLHLGVMFYVHDVSLLEDEVTRFHYFMQLKYDVLDGKLRCNFEQAIVLASYSLQAESGDHDSERHTLDNLQDLPLLPKTMNSQLSEERFAALTDAIMAQHASLRGIARQLAEVYYIVGAQQLDGYGQECFLARDERGTEVLIGASLTGIVIRQGTNTQFFKWNDITNLVNHKRYFGIECQNYERSVQFILDEPDSAKYVWKMCVLQHTFYKLHASATETMSELNITLEHQPNFQTSSNNNRYIDEEESRHPVSLQIAPKLKPAVSSGSVHKQANYVQDDMVLLNNASRSSLFNQTITAARSVNDLDQLPSQQPPNQHHLAQNTLPAYRAAPDYETAIRNKFGVPAHQPQIWQQQQSGGQHIQTQPKLITEITHNLVNSFSIPEDQHPQFPVIQQQQPQQTHPASSLYSTSTPELNRINMTYHHHQHQHPNAQVYQMPTQDQIVAELQRLNLYKPPPPYPGTNANGQHQHVGHQPNGLETRMISSTSTPDLASSNIISTMNATHSGIVLGGSSPDLVSRKNLGRVANHNSSTHSADKESNLHKTMENLTNLMEHQQQLQYEPDGSNTEPTNANYGGFSQQVMAAASSHTHKYSNVSSTPGSEPTSEPIYQNQAELRKQLQLLDKREPIYQNLPAHEKMLLKEHQQLLLTTKPNEDNDDAISSTSTTKIIKSHVSRVAITNSREDLSQHSEYINPPSSEVDIVDNARKKSVVTKINIGTTSANTNLLAQQQKPAEIDNLPDIKQGNNSAAVKNSHVFDKETIVAPPALAEKNTITKAIIEGQPVSHPQVGTPKAQLIKSPPKKPARAKASQSVENISAISDDLTTFDESITSGLLTPSSSSNSASKSNTINAPRTPSSKPRAGRKRWAFNFGGSKTGSLKSLKSVKSSGGEDDEDKKDSSIKLGPMMLATLHGLTRSRPDLLAESMSTFSTFAAPSRMPKDEIGAYLEAKLAEGEVLREFERIPKKKVPSGHGYEQLFRTATLAENIPLNRFKDVLPYDENRVKLAAGDKDNRNGYINASHVSATVGNQQRFYIAGQGPLPHTVPHFWQMVHQCDVHLIVMLTESSNETGATACIPYWPTKTGATVEVGNGFKITNLSSATHEDAYTTTTLKLTHTPSKKTRTIWHLQYIDWGEAGCPSNVRAFLNFLEELSALRNHITTNAVEIIGVGRNKNPPALVHCSAGVGRTGVAILTDILLYCVDHNVDIDIPKMLTHLRQQRMLMVQTVAQYKFVHTALIAYLKQSRLI